MNKIKSALFSALAALAFVACSSESPVVAVASSSSTPDVVLSSSSAVVVNPSLIGTGANSALVDTWYATWKAKYFVTMNEQIAAGATTTFYPFLNTGLNPGRVRWDNGSSYSCSIDGLTAPDNIKYACSVSEGIGYGMLITLFQEDWTAFEALYQYNHGMITYFQGSIGSYMMPWVLASFEDYKDMSAATDADLDIAVALMIAYQKLATTSPELANKYLSWGKTIATAIWNEVVAGSCSKNYLVCPGNAAMWYNADVFNLSYFSPVAFRVFAAFDADHDWTGVLNANYAYMQAAQQANGSGLLPDWSNAAGTPVLSPNNSSTNSYNTYGKEAVRIAWRIAWDYYWFGDARAKSVLDGMGNFIVTATAGVPTNVPAKAYKMDGTLGTNSTQAGAHLASYCLMGSASYADWYTACVNEFNTQGWTDSYGYFTQILQMMFGQLINGKYVNPF